MTSQPPETSPPAVQTSQQTSPPLVQTSQQTSQVQGPLVTPVVTPSQMTSQPSQASQASQGSQPGVKEEPKAVEGASLPSVKYARIAGLIAKSLNEFKVQFEASFPKDDIAKAIAAANCTIVDGKVMFIGG